MEIELFDSIDTNKNSSINKEELHAFCKKLIADYPEDKIADDWTAIDHNSEGKIERIVLFLFFKEELWN